MRKRKSDLAPTKAIHSQKGRSVRRPEQMCGAPVFETEASLRARVRQPIAPLLPERPHEWKKAPQVLVPGGWYLSNEDIWQAKAFVWPVEGRYRVRLRGLPDEWPDCDTLDEAMTCGLLQVNDRLSAGWDPYTPVRQTRRTDGEGK